MEKCFLDVGGHGVTITAKSNKNSCEIIKQRRSGGQTIFQAWSICYQRQHEGGGGGGGCDGVLLNAMVWKAVEFVSILTRFWNFLYESPLFLVNDNLGIRFQFFRILG